MDDDTAANNDGNAASNDDDATVKGDNDAAVNCCVGFTVMNMTLVPADAG